MSEFAPLSDLRVDLDPATIDTQEATILRSLAQQRRRQARPRTRLVAVMVAALVVLQAGVVWAAEDALPGDALYDVKLAYEAPRSWFDHDLRLRNRLDEASALIDARPEVADALLDAADLEVDDATDPELVEALDGLRLRLQVRARDGSGTGNPGGQGGNGPGRGGP